MYNENHNKEPTEIMELKNKMNEIFEKVQCRL